MKISGNSILITGATSGIGLAFLKKFHALNNRVIAVGRNSVKLEQVKKEYPGIETVVCDLNKGNDVLQLIETCHNRFPTLNILINNAGIQYNYLFAADPADYKKIQQEITINLTSPLQLCFGLLPLLQKQTESAVVNISSALAITPKKAAPVYCSTKAAMHSFTKTLRYQLEKSQVHVFEIIPPLVDTAMTAGRGKGKISPDQVVNEFTRNFIHNKYESYIGKAKFLNILYRLFPRLAAAMLKNG